MKPINLSARLLSEVVWRRLFEQSATPWMAMGTTFYVRLAELEALRARAQYNTGSISTATQWALFSLAHYLEPKVVAEVGTFIGKSAIALAQGMDFAGVCGEIHTCDMSNDFELPSMSKSEIIQYPATASTEMFRDLHADGYAGRVDLVHVDGRLSADDVALLEQLMSPKAVIALDDFEGIEKGVANLVSIRGHERLQNHVLIHPPRESMLREFGFWDHSMTALLLPSSLIRLTGQ